MHRGWRGVNILAFACELNFEFLALGQCLGWMTFWIQFANPAVAKPWADAIRDQDTDRWVMRYDLVVVAQTPTGVEYRDTLRELWGSIVTSTVTSIVTSIVTRSDQQDGARLPRGLANSGDGKMKETRVRVLILSFCVMALTLFDSTILLAQLNAGALKITPDDWPWWRGPNRDGVVFPEVMPPIRWSESENVQWRVPVVGRGHGSPIVLGNRVFLATADKEQEVQVVLCWDRRTGQRVWEATVHRGGFQNRSGKPANEKASLASSTMATDGHQLYVNFLNDNAVHTSALTLQGEVIWQQRVCDYTVHQGYGTSPALYQNLVLVSADNKAGGAIAALDRATGEILWLRSRPKKPNYVSPNVMHLHGKDQLILSGCDLVTSLNPLTGEVIWEIEGSTTECVTTSVTDGEHVFTSGGYPTNHLAAVRADGTGEIVWQRNTRVYVPSMLQHDGYLYATLDAGVASCFRCSDGKEMWKARLGGTFSGSPVMVGDRIYATNEDGTTFIIRASPEGFEQLGKNQVGDNVFATPAICGGQIFLRVAKMENGRRNEYLYCISTK